MAGSPGFSDLTQHEKVFTLSATPAVGDKIWGYTSGEFAEYTISSITQYSNYCVATVTAAGSMILTSSYKLTRSPSDDVNDLWDSVS